MQAVIKAHFELFGILKKKDGWHIAHCPPLDITTQGRTRDEAKKNLIEAAELFVTSCFERGTFEQALRELGWRVVGRDLIEYKYGITRDAFPSLLNNC